MQSIITNLLIIKKIWQIFSESRKFQTDNLKIWNEDKIPGYGISNIDIDAVKHA